MADRIAVVTGANKGIGLAIVRRLCLEFEGTVYLTARNPLLGKEALDTLTGQLVNKKCKSLRFFPLDITKKETIVNLRDHLTKEHGGLDILVNNAGIAYKMASTAPFGEQAEKTAEINYYGTKSACEILFPILKPHARVVNVSSTAGLLKQVPSEELKAQFLDKHLTIGQLDGLMSQFIEYAKQGTHKEHGFSGSAYGMSKICVTALTFIQQRMFHDDPRPDLVVNACCPGYVDTDMTSHRGHLTPDQGAETPIYLALLPPKVTKPRGAFVYCKKETDWTTGDFL